MEGLNALREICVSKSIGLALFLEGNLPFSLFYFVFEGNFQAQAPQGAYIWRGNLIEGFFCVMSLGGLHLEGLIHGGAYFQNFTVASTCTLYVSALQSIFLYEPLLL